MQIIIHEGMYILMMICISNISIIHNFYMSKLLRKRYNYLKERKPMIITQVNDITRQTAQ